MVIKDLWNKRSGYKKDLWNMGYAIFTFMYQY